MNTKQAARTAQKAIMAEGAEVRRRKTAERAALKKRGEIESLSISQESYQPVLNDSGSSRKTWLSKVSALAPSSVSESDLQAAREKLNAKYSGVDGVEDPDKCPRCAGLGVIRLNEAANPGDSDFGRVQPCPESNFHAKDRVKTLARISNLSVPELGIRLTDLEPYHRPKEQCETGIFLEDGSSLMATRSNIEMIDSFRKLATDPYSGAGMFFLLGPWGGGKTFAVMGLVNEINLNSKGPAVYITLPDLIGFLVAAYDKRNQDDDEFGDWSFERRYEAMAEAKMIVVDEFDFSDSKVRGTDHNLQLLQRWFDRRYRSGIYNQTLTVLVSNSPIEDMGLGGVSSRASDGRFRTILNTAPDMRPKQGGRDGKTI